MKFVKSKFAQKLIIILIVLMIFNIAVPKQVSAWDLGGILLKPITSAILGFLVSVDVSIGVLLNGLSIGVNAIGGIIEILSEENAKSEALNDISTALSQLFIGPDTIFSGDVRFLDANIFEVESFTTTKDFYNTIINSGLVENINELSDATSPGYHLIVRLKEGIGITYRILRNICAYIMLAGLIFTGIRILVSSNIPTKKTQYLMLLQDWLIGMVLLIFSHVIMVGIFYLSDTLVDALKLTLNGVGGLNFSLIIQCLLSLDSAEQIICLVMLGYLIYLTIVFAVAYLKRLMWVCVLIVIAPVVSIMYAFGNSTKGIYSKWLREYITTVLVQPFHILVYYILVSIPLNMSNSTGGFSLSGSNFFEIIYCLVAISFIRPAEKYIRDLFGMGQGIAGMASFDSGKKTIDAAIKSVGALAITAGSAGLGGAAIGALKGGTALRGVAEASKSILGNGKIGNAYGKVIDGVVSKVEGTVDTAGKIKDKVGGIFSRDERSEAVDSNNTPLKTNDSTTITTENNAPSNDTLETSNEPTITTKNNVSSEATSETSNETLKTTETSDNLTADETHERTIQTEIDDKKDGESGEATIGTDEKLMQAGEKLYEAAEKLEKAETSSEEKEEKEKSDEQVIVKEGEDVQEDQKQRWRDRRNDFISVATGQKSVFDALSGITPDKGIGRVAGQFMNSDLGKSLNRFEELGGLKQLHAGFNEIRDTFYVTPPAGDWKETNARMDSKSKERIEQQKFNLIHNEGNIQYIINQKDYIKKFREQYPDKVKYPDAYIQNMAKEKAKSDLKSLADEFVPLGVTDVKIAYECYKDRENYGISAVDAVKLHADFEKFDNSQTNVSIINNNGKYGENNSRVSEGMPSAREYYNSGYRDVNAMAWVDQIAKSIEKLPQFKDKKDTERRQFAIKIDQELRKKGGKVEYNGKDKNVADVVGEINKIYGK